MGRQPKAAPIDAPVAQPAPAPADHVVVTDVVRVPTFPCFSPAAIAALLVVHRATVHNWLERGKLTFFRDNINERYVMRSELVRFVREYLGRSVQ